MNNNYGERLKMYRKAAGLNQKDLADRLGVDRSLISHWERGINKFDLDMLQPISKALGISVNDLLGYYTDYSLNPNEEKLVRVYRKLDDSGKKIVLGLAETLLEYRIRSEKNRDPHPKDEKAKIISMPVFDLPASAGTGSFLDTDGYELMDFPEGAIPRGSNFSVRVSGDSMEPEFKDGSVVFVKQTKDVAPGEVGIFILNNEGFIKIRGHGNRLESINKKYKDIVIGPYDDCRIVGKVIGKY